MTTTLNRKLLFSAVAAMGCALALPGSAFAKNNNTPTGTDNPNAAANGGNGQSNVGNGNNGNGVGNTGPGNQGNDGNVGNAGGPREFENKQTSRDVVTCKSQTVENNRVKRGCKVTRCTSAQYQVLKQKDPTLTIVSTDGGDQDNPELANMETSFVGSIFAPNTFCNVTYVPGREVEDGVTIPTEDDLDTCENVYFKRVKCYFTSLKKEKCFKFRRRTDAEVAEEARGCQRRVDEAKREEKSARDALNNAEEDVNRKTREHESCKRDRDAADRKQKASLRARDEAKRNLQTRINQYNSRRSEMSQCSSRRSRQERTCRSARNTVRSRESDCSRAAWRLRDKQRAEDRLCVRYYGFRGNRNSSSFRRLERDYQRARESRRSAQRNVDSCNRRLREARDNESRCNSLLSRYVREENECRGRLDSARRAKDSAGVANSQAESRYRSDRNSYDSLRRNCDNKFRNVQNARRVAEERERTLKTREANARQVINECEAVLEEDRKRKAGIDSMDDVNFDEVSSALNVLVGYVEQEFRLHQQERLAGNRKGWSNTCFSTVSFRKNGQLCVAVYTGLYTKKTGSSDEVSVATYERDCRTKSRGNSDPLKSNSSLKRNSESDSFRDKVCSRIQYDWKKRCRGYANFKRLAPAPKKPSTRYVEVKESTDKVFDTRRIPSRSEEVNKDALANLCAAYQGKKLSAAQKRIKEVLNQGFGKDIQNVRVPDFYVRLGDEDAFGFRNIGNYYASFGGPCDTDGDGLLGPGEFMPNLDGGPNRKSACRTGGKDDFCNRDDLELADAANYSNGCVVHVGTTGSKYTDVALSTSWDASLKKSKTKGFYYNHVGKDHDGRMHTIAGRSYEQIASAGFPDGGASRNRPNMPGLVIDCKINQPTLAKLRRNNKGGFGSIFVNILAADWDVPPFKLVITNASGDSYDYPITRQSNAKGEDGMVQAGFVTLSLNDFCDLDGNFFLQANFEAPNEPYITIDYLEVSTRQITIEPEQNELYVTGDIQVGPEGETKYDITDHSGAKLRAESLRFVPEAKLDKSQTPTPRTFGPGTTTILTSETYDNFVLSSGATVIIKGDVILNVLGNMEVPVGSRLIMEDISPGRPSKAQIFVGGDVTISGMFENTVAKNFRIISTQDASNGGAGVNITISKDFIGALAAKDVRITTENGGKISFIYDKAAALQGIEGSKERLVVKALLDDKLGN